jgi:glycosyltransferase involved in cell wall biosynthesis
MDTDALPVLIMADSLRVGGTERQVIALLKGLQQHGQFRAFLLTVNRGGELEQEAASFAADLLDAGRHRLFDVKPLVRLVQHARAKQARLLHVFGWMSGVFGLLAARWLGVPIINGSVRDAPPRLRPLDRISRQCARLSDAIVANSRAGLEAYGLASHPRASVIYSGVDLDRFEAVRPRPADGIAICMVANFSRYKDHATVVSAFARIRSASPDARLILVGKDVGTLHDTRRLVEHLQIAGAVTFVTDTVRPESIVAGSRLCILASNPRTHGEGSANALLEYMALAKPVVATDTGGTREIIRSEESGVVVPAGSAEALAHAVVGLLRDPARAVAMGAAAQRRVRAEFSLARMVAEYQALYLRALDRRPQGPTS